MKGKLVWVEGYFVNIILIYMDVFFFFERVVCLLDCNYVDKVLKYFCKVVEYELENLVNYCNMVGILFEKGDYEVFNVVLVYVLEVVDLFMMECYFYMVNNYVNMDWFEEVEQVFVMYLEEDFQGQFMMEVEEMMEFLYYELDCLVKLNWIKFCKGVVEYDQVRELLEEGKFVQVVEFLEGMLLDYFDYLVVCNNFVLVYYYMGLFFKVKEMIVEVLEQELGNLYVLCNFVIFYQNENWVD